MSLGEDGSYVVSSGGLSDKTLQFWDLKGKKLIKVFEFSSGVSGCAINSSFICGVDYAGTVKVFDYDGKVLFSEQFAEGSK